MITRYLPLSELQSIIPEDQIRDIETLVRRLDARGGNPITNKDFLARLYDAYFGPDLLANQKHRRRLLEFVPQKRLLDLAIQLGLPSDVKFSLLADRIANLPWDANETTATFLQFFGYPQEYMPEQKNFQSTNETITPFEPPLKVLQDYQASVYFNSFSMLDSPCARFMIQMPTGAGKTRTAMELIAAYLNKDTTRKVLWLAHKEELCEQALASFREVWMHVGRIPITLVRCWEKYTPNFPLPPSSIMIAGFQKLHRLRKSGMDSPGADLIVVDEAHMVLAPTYEAVVNWAKTLSARIIGLSATPGRGASGAEENVALADFFNREIVGIETDGVGVIKHLQGRGILARVDREPLYTNISFALDKEEWEKLEEELDYPSGFLKRLAENYKRNRIIIEKLWELADAGAQVLVFATSVEQSRLLCALMLYRGIPAAHIDGNTSKQTRRAVIAKFKRSDIHFLFNYQIFATGFDAPNIDVVFIARPTKSRVLYSQMLGRGLRGPAIGGTHSVRLVDVIDNIIDHSSNLDDVYDYFSEYWA